MLGSRRVLPLVAVLVVAVAGDGKARAAGSWSEVTKPAPGPAESIGEPAAGCLRGAQALALAGPGYQAVRTSRHRYYGHPELVGYVRSLGLALRSAGLSDVYVGDLGQPRGGPMPGAHASHQSGLDADVLFDLSPKPQRAAAGRENVGAVTLVQPDNRSVDPARWLPAHARLLAMAVEPAEVERVFVHPAIKAELCRTTEGDRAWLRKVRPWYGHDAHFHVRLRCPADSHACVAGPALPQGDGCDETLAWWFEEEDGRLHAYREVDERPPAMGERERPALPEACASVLRGR
jgi:penicillin-insensitive murein endopeptidase